MGLFLYIINEYNQGCHVHWVRKLTDDCVHLLQEMHGLHGGVLDTIAVCVLTVFLSLPPSLATCCCVAAAAAWHCVYMTAWSCFRSCPL